MRVRLGVQDIDRGTIWVCQCCMLEHANGECCADDSHGGDGVAPWSNVDDRYRVTMGLDYSEHDEDCRVRVEDGWPSGYDCDCERREFSSSQCEGCGSSLAGDRWAFGLWRTRRRFVRVSLPA